MNKSFRVAIWEFVAFLFGLLFCIAFALWCSGTQTQNFASSPDLENWVSGQQMIDNMVSISGAGITLRLSLVVLAVVWMIGVVGCTVSIFGAVTEGTFRSEASKTRKEQIENE